MPIQIQFGFLETERSGNKRIALEVPPSEDVKKRKAKEWSSSTLVLGIEYCPVCLSPEHSTVTTSCCAPREVTADELPPNIPEYININLLSARNPHLYDFSIKFLENVHKYYVRWYAPDQGMYTCANTVSVSTFVHDYFGHFDPDTTIHRMINGRNWNPNNKYYGMTPCQIKAMWEENGRRASDQGSKFHLLLECFYNGMDLIPWRRFRPIQQFLRWHRGHVHGKLIPFRTEWRLRTDNATRLTGTIDIIFIEPDHPPPEQTGGVLRLHMKDWKFSKEIRKKGFGNKKGSGPCCGLDDCNYSHYALQLNTYQSILEKFYTDMWYRGKKYDRIKVLSRELAVFHDIREEAEVVRIPRMSECVDEMMRRRKEKLQQEEGEKDEHGTMVYMFGKELPTS